MKYMKRNRRAVKHHFYLFFLALLAIFVLSPVTHGQKKAAEHWVGDLDLHQGDTGTITFTRNGTAIEGETIVHRGANTFKHKIKGTWSGEIIRFWRTLNPPTSGQNFAGITLMVEMVKSRWEDVLPPTLTVSGVQNAGKFL